MKNAFVARISTFEAFGSLLDTIGGHSFFMKDSDYRLMAANTAFCENLDVESEDVLIGKNDFELFPERLAESFRRDDEAVIQSGEPRCNILELFFNLQGMADWFITSKFPLRDAGGDVIGLIGIARRSPESGQGLSPYTELEKAVDFLRSHYTKKITMAELAAMTDMSVRQFNRRFKEAFNTTPQSFLLKTRIQAACELLRNTDIPIGRLALQLGFYDQSSFTVHFNKHMDTTPNQYRHRIELR